MTWHIDSPVRVGRDVFAAIAKAHTKIHRTRQSMVGHGEKRPVLYLLMRDDAVSGIDCHGNRQTRDEIEHRYPGAIRQLRALIDQET